jgi:hypothetical protein
MKTLQEIEAEIEKLAAAAKTEASAVEHATIDSLAELGKALFCLLHHAVTKPAATPAPVAPAAADPSAAQV